MTPESFKEDLETMITMLSYKRPAGSESEHEFIKRFLEPLGAEQDKHGNLILKIGDDPKVLWSAHTDTVHHGPGRQRVVYDNGVIKLHRKSNSSCLGADNGAGCFILTKLAKAQVPGLYIWHYGEERGGLGSSALVKATPELVDGVQMAFAFDRRGIDSVITHQRGGRCCSEAFGKSLMAQLPGYRLDPGGIFTDTANYRELIPECTNLSIGFQSEHTSNEQLNFLHVMRLWENIEKLDLTALAVERDPKFKEPDIPWWRKHARYGRYSNGYGQYAGGRYDNGRNYFPGWAGFDDEVWDYESPAARPEPKQEQLALPAPAHAANGNAADPAADDTPPDAWEQVLGKGGASLGQLLWRQPFLVAEVLEEMGFTIEDIGPFVAAKVVKRIQNRIPPAPKQARNEAERRIPPVKPKQSKPKFTGRIKPKRRVRAVRGA